MTAVRDPVFNFVLQSHKVGRAQSPLCFLRGRPFEALTSSRRQTCPALAKRLIQ